LLQQDVSWRFLQREARPSDNEVLTMRLVDRVLRPRTSDYHAEVQVMIQLMSHDDDVMPDALAGLAASAALALSDIPFATLISEARVGYRRKFISIKAVHN
jgi:polyribonucleotide nucleotidyltransferase